MANSTNLQLTLLEAAQAQKHVTVNEGLQALDVIVQLTVKDRDLTAPPGAPADGDRYIVGSSATGTWASQDKNIAAYQDGVWNFYNPHVGWRCWIEDESILLIHDGTDWVVFSPASNGIDVNGNNIILDSDGNTFINTGTNDQVTFTIGGTDVFILAPGSHQFRRTGGAPTLSIARDDTHGSGANVAQLKITGKSSTGIGINYGNIFGQALSDTAGTENGAFLFQTIVSGTIGARMKIGGGIYHSSATGGDKGNNTINFGAVYDDNVLLTCYGFAQENEGFVNPVEWDRYSAPKLDEDGHVINPPEHKPAKDFIARQATFDQTDPDQYADFWRTNGHFPNLPGRSPGYDHGRDKLSIGACAQKLIEICEMQTIHIEKLNQRLKKLERI